MNPQDIIFNRLRERGQPVNADNQWVAFIITDKAREFVARVMGLGKIESIANSVDAIFLRPNNGEAFLKDCYENKDLMVHDCSSYMGYYPALLNARQLADRERLKDTENMVADYYGPKIDALIHEHHHEDGVSEIRKAKIREEITELVHEMPSTIGRTCTIDRLCHGRDKFDQLRKAGVTIDNWHIIEEVKA